MATLIISADAVLARSLEKALAASPNQAVSTRVFSTLDAVPLAALDGADAVVVDESTVGMTAIYRRLAGCVRDARLIILTEKNVTYFHHLTSAVVLSFPINLHAVCRQLEENYV